MNDFLIGVCDATPLSGVGDAPFVSKDISKRTDPCAIMPDARSVIVVAVPYEKKILDLGTIYNCPHIHATTMQQSGFISSLVTNSDYHKRVKDILHTIAQDIKQYKILVDSPYLDERAFAQRAGIGYYGRHGLIITEKYGTRCNLGLLITDRYIPTTCVLPEEFCSTDCKLCIKSCPTSALSDHGFNYKICISYLTQKADLLEHEAKLIGNHLYGCDICQNICPKNKPEEIYHADPEKWLTMSDDKWKELYGHTAILWQGNKILKRNAKVVINNLTGKT